MTILVVDPDGEGRACLMRKAQADFPNGCILEFVDPLMAVKYAYDSPVDALYASRYMQRMDGDKLAQLVRKRLGQGVIINICPRLLGSCAPL